MLAGDPPAVKHQIVSRGVSIRARHCWRAIRASIICSGVLSLFQSAPAIAGGRSNCACLGSIDFTQFQSAPAIAGGRSLSAALSFLTRCSFNPRPPLLAGDPRCDPRINSLKCVSIRARHCWRAIPPHHPLAQPVVRFQSAPAIAGGRSNLALRCTGPDCCFNPRPPRAIRGFSHIAGDDGQFQSAPAIAGGRSRTECRAKAGTHCFNPRPPLLAGDPATTTVTLPAIVVSIRARHCWRAILRPLYLAAGAKEFQSAPAIAGGRSCLDYSFGLILKSFNPRPPLLAGDPAGVDAAIASMDVSIRARHCWRAILVCIGNCQRDRGFNPRPPLLAGDPLELLPPVDPPSVSIRARHCWRAIRGANPPVGLCTTGFNPRPPLLAGDPLRLAPRVCRLSLFQSAPAIAGGRSMVCASVIRHPAGFNPRPPLLAGDPQRQHPCHAI